MSSPRRDVNDGSDADSAPLSALQSGPCDLLRLPKSRRFAAIARCIHVEHRDTVVHFSCECSEVIEGGLVPRIVAVSERAIYKFPISAVDSDTNGNNNNNNEGAVVSFGFEERRFPMADMSELVAIDGSDGDLQGHALKGLDVQAFGGKQQGAPRLLFVLNFADLTARRQAFLLNCSMVAPEVPIMQKQRIKKIAGAGPSSSAAAAQQHAMKKEADSAARSSGASPAKLASASASPSRQTDNGGWMSPEAMKAIAAEKRRAAAAKARAANRERIRGANPDEVFDRLYAAAAAAANNSNNDRSKSGGIAAASKPMHAPSSFNAQRREALRREHDELPEQLRPEFYAHLSAQLREGEDDESSVAAVAASDEGAKAAAAAARLEGARSIVQGDDRSEIRVPSRDLDDRDFVALQAAIHSELLSDRADIARRDGKGYPGALFKSPDESPLFAAARDDSQPRVRARTILQNASFDRKPVAVEHTELTPERAEERHQIRMMLQSREEATDLDARYREATLGKPALTSFDGRVVPTYEKSNAAKLAPKEPTDQELLGPSLFPLWRHWRDCGGLLSVLKEQKRVARMNQSAGGGGSSVHASRHVDVSALDDDDFDLCWTLFDSNDLINSLKSQESELLGQIGTKSIERLKNMRKLVEREMRMYVNSTGKNPLAKNSNGGENGNELPLSSRLAAYAPPPGTIEGMSSPGGFFSSPSAGRSVVGGSSSKKATRPAPFRLSLSPTLERFVHRRLAVDDDDVVEHSNRTDGGVAPPAAAIIQSPTKRGVQIRLYDRDCVAEVVDRVQRSLSERRAKQLALMETTRPGRKTTAGGGGSGAAAASGRSGAGSASPKR